MDWTIILVNPLCLPEMLRRDRIAYLTSSVAHFNPFSVFFSGEGEGEEDSHRIAFLHPVRSRTEQFVCHQVIVCFKTGSFDVLISLASWLVSQYGCSYRSCCVRASPESWDAVFFSRLFIIKRRLVKYSRHNNRIPIVVTKTCLLFWPPVVVVKWTRPASGGVCGIS